MSQKILDRVRHQIEKKKTQNPGHRSRTRFTQAATALTVMVIAKNHILGQICPLV